MRLQCAFLLCVQLQFESIQHFTLNNTKCSMVFIIVSRLFVRLIGYPVKCCVTHMEAPANLEWREDP